jgi:hypothetical protein
MIFSYYTIIFDYIKGESINQLTTTMTFLSSCEQAYQWARGQRQETLDLPYLTLLCDNLKNRMFLQNFFS